jgi:hypothetical protein
MFVATLVAVVVASRALLLPGRSRRRRAVLAGVLLAVLGALTLPVDDLAGIGLAIWYASAMLGVFLAGRARRSAAAASTTSGARLRAERLTAIVLVATGAGALVAIALGTDPLLAGALAVCTFVAVEAHVPQPGGRRLPHDRWELAGMFAVVLALGLLVPWPHDFGVGALLIAFGLGAGIGAPVARRLHGRARRTPSTS